MKVEIYILTATGRYTFEVPTNNVDKARELIRQGKCRLVSTDSIELKLNYDSIKEVEEDEHEVEEDPGT